MFSLQAASDMLQQWSETKWNFLKFEKDEMKEMLVILLFILNIQSD